MADQFDPWQRWLGISPAHQPADHYRLLGLSRFESDTDVIANAAERTTELIEHKAGDEHAAEAGQLLKAIAEARTCLLDSQRKAAYDRALKRRRRPSGSGGKAPPPLPRPRALDTPPFQPSPPPYESGAPPIQGEPPPPPVAGEPVSQPRPALPSGDLPRSPRPPTPRVKPPVGRIQPVATTPQPPPVGQEPATPEPPPVANVTSDESPSASAISLPVKPLAAQPAQPAKTAAASPPSKTLPKDVAKGKTARRPVPLPYTGSQPTPEEADLATDEKNKRPGAATAPPSQDRASSKTTIPSQGPATGKARPPSSKRGVTESPPTGERPARPILVAAAPGHSGPTPGDGAKETGPRPGSSARSSKLPWPIILPAAGIVLAIAAGLVVLLGGFGSGQSNPADSQPGAGDSEVTLDTDEGDVPVDRDEEGSIASATTVDDAASPDDPENDGAQAAAVAEPDPNADTPGSTPDAGTETDGSAGASSTPADGAADQTMANDTEPAAPPAAGTTNGESPPAEAPEPPPPPQNPLKELPKSFDLAAATTAARQAARDDPLNEKAGQIQVGKVDLASGQTLNLRLLGGKTAVPGGWEFKLQPVFSLEDDSRWRVNLVEEPDVVIPVGQFAISNDNLVYDWLADGDVKSSEYLQNCTLDAWTGDHRHVMPLRKPVPAKEVLLELHTNEFQDSIPVATLPDASSLRLEVVRVTGTSLPTRLPSDASIWLGESMLIDLLDKNRNAKASLRVSCEGAHAGRVRFRVNPMARAAGGAPVTMGIQAATSQVNKLQREKEALQQQIKAIDAQMKFLQGQSRELANKNKHARQTRIRTIDHSIGMFNSVLSLLKPLHQKASLQLRVVMNADGQDVVLAGPPKGKPSQ